MGAPANPFIVDKRTIGLKIESTPYTKETLAASDYQVRVFNVTYTPEIEEYARKYATGDFDAFTSVMGKRKLTISCSADLAWSGAVATPPEWSDWLRACAFLRTIHGATGVSWVPHADSYSLPATMEIQEIATTTANAIVVQGRGMMGNVIWILDALGNPIRMDFEYIGVFDGIVDRAFGDIIDPANFDLTEPDAVLASTITAFGDAQDIDTVNLNIGNVIELYGDPAKEDGYRGAYKVRHEPSLALDPYLALRAESDHFARWTQGTTGAFSMSIGNNLTLSAPAVQDIAAYPAGERTGFSTNAVQMKPSRNAGNDIIKLLQGSES